MRGVTVLVSLAYFTMYCGTALLRMAYPYELEWMEGGVLDHMTRLLEGKAIYVRPNLEFVAFPYTPLYYYLGAVASFALGPGFLPLRLVSFASSLGCFWIVYRLVRIETGDPVASVLAMGTFAATYRLSGAWMDLARPDSLFLLLFWVGVYVFRVARGRMWWAGAVAFCLAFLVKQVALPMMLPVLAWGVWRDRRNGVAAVLAAGSLSGLAVLAGDLRSDGWFTYYVFSLPSHFPPVARAIANFFRQDLLGLLSIAVAFAGAVVLLPLRGRDPARTLFLAAFAAGAFGGSFLMRVHPGGFWNTLMAAHSALAVLFAIGYHQSRSLLGNGSSVSAGRAALLLSLACVAQLVSLAYDPRSILPTVADRRAGRIVEAAIRDVAGDVLIWSHPYLARRAGKPGHGHEMAVRYVIAGDGAGEGARLESELERAITSRRYAAVLVDDAMSMPAAGSRAEYFPARTILEDETALRTKTGRITRPEVLWLPRDGTAQPGSRPGVGSELAPGGPGP